jgi:hypothetical protein
MLLLWSRAPNDTRVNWAKIIQNRVGAYLDFDDVIAETANARAVEKYILKVHLEA